MSELEHKKTIRHDAWGEFAQETALAALESATKIVPAPDMAELVHRALLWLWRMARNGKNLGGYAAQWSADELAFAETTALEAGYGRLEALRLGARKGRASLQNNLINVMAYAVKKDAIQQGQTGVAFDGGSQNGRSSFEAAPSVFEQDDDDDDEYDESKDESRWQARQVLGLQRRWAAALEAGRVAPLGSPDHIGRAFAISRYHYGQFGFTDDIPAVDDYEMEARLAMASAERTATKSRLIAASRGELKQIAEAEGGSPETIKRRYDALRKQQSRAMQRAAPENLLAPEAVAAIDEVVQRSEFPVKARVALGGMPDNITARYFRASRSLPESTRAVRRAQP